MNVQYHRPVESASLPRSATGDDLWRVLESAPHGYQSPTATERCDCRGRAMDDREDGKGSVPIDQEQQLPPWNGMGLARGASDVWWRAVSFAWCLSQHEAER